MTAATPGGVVRPECRYEIHEACKIGPVYVNHTGRVPAGTPGASLAVPPKRCDCPCHEETRR